MGKGAKMVILVNNVGKFNIGYFIFLNGGF